MIQSHPVPGARPSPWWRRVGGVAFVLTPWLSLGYGTPIAFLFVAALFSRLGKIHAVILWLSAAVYTAVVFVELNTVEAVPGTTGERVFYGCLVITMVGGGLQALVFTIVAAVKGYRSGGNKALPKTSPTGGASREAPGAVEVRERAQVAPADLERAMTGWWVVHPSRSSYLGEECFRRRPKSHIVFDGPGWRMFETGTRWRLSHAVGISCGSWRIVDLDGQALLVLTVRSYRPSAVSQAILILNYGYTGGDTAVAAATTSYKDETVKMRAGQARMYFLPEQLRPHEVILTLPSNGSCAPRQRWVRPTGDPDVLAESESRTKRGSGPAWWRGRRARPRALGL